MIYLKMKGENMKKGLKILFISLFVILISGCGNEKTNVNTNKDTAKETINTCTLSSDQSSNGYTLSSNYEIHSKDGLVNSVTTKETVESDNEQVRSYFKKTLEDSYNTANESYGGYTYNVTEDGNKVISDVTIDYSKMNLDKFVNDNSQMKSYIKNNKISLDGMKKIYEALGATCN
ncbi:MAG TPA: hypothetical protein DHV70_06740 [Firmicutes bacterium]|nr:hypothetical protein [Bacillota bacterium]